MHRRKFLARLSGAVAAVAGGLAGIVTGRGIFKPTHFKGVPPNSSVGYAEYCTFRSLPGDAVFINEGTAESCKFVEYWPAQYSLAVKLPQPKNRPTEEQPLGISYWIQRPTEVVECQHVGNGFYVGQHRGMKLRAIAERRGGKLICNYTVWEGEWNA